MFKFIASSILIAYEGKDSTIPHASLEDQELNDEMPDLNNIELLQVKNCQPEKALVEVRMIDAAHVFSSSVVDSNYLSGLENVVAIFEHIRANLGN